jgi:hypothetical protein
MPTYLSSIIKLANRMREYLLTGAYTAQALADLLGTSSTRVQEACRYLKARVVGTHVVPGNTRQPPRIYTLMDGQDEAKALVSHLTQGVPKPLPVRTAVALDLNSLWNDTGRTPRADGGSNECENE